MNVVVPAEVVALLMELCQKTATDCALSNDKGADLGVGEIECGMYRSDCDRGVRSIDDAGNAPPRRPLGYGADRYSRSPHRPKKSTGNIGPNSHRLTNKRHHRHR